MFRSETLNRLFDQSCDFNCYWFITDSSGFEEHTRHSTGKRSIRAASRSGRPITRFRRSQYNQVSIVYTGLFNNRVPRRCHNRWNWFLRLQTTLTASGPSVCWCCVTNAQLLQVIVDCAGDTHERFRGTLTQLT